MNLKTIENKIYEGAKLNEDEENFLLKKVQNYWDNHPDVTNRYPRWKKYIAWVAGYQTYDYNKTYKKLYEVPLNREKRVVINKLKPYVRTLLSKLTADVPVPSVIPNTNDDDDICAARIGDKLIEGVANKINFDMVIKDLKLWTILCNRAYLHVFWNEEDKGVIGYGNTRGANVGGGAGNKPEEGNPNVDIETPPSDVELAGAGGLPSNPQEETTGEPTYEEGDVCIESVSPFNCRPDPLYQERSRWRWFIYGDEVDAEWVENKWELAEGSLKEKDDVLDNAYELTLQDEQDINIGQPSQDEDVTGRTVTLKEFWTPRIYVFCTEKKVLQYGINEYGEIPFFDVEDRIIPIDSYEKGFTYNESLIKDAIPIQREYNRQASIISQALERCSKLKVLTPLGSLLSKKQWVNDYGVFIDYNRNAGEPHQMKMDPFPVELTQYKNDLEREMEATVSLSPASFGRLPERASHASGTLVSLLLEQDDVILNPILNQINNVMGKAWTLALRLIQENYIIGRYLRVTGSDGSGDIESFKGTDLRGNTNVTVTNQSGLPRSRALRVEYIMKLRESGLLRDDKTTLEMLEFGNASKIFSETLVHERKAHRENSMIEKQPNIDPNAVQPWLYPLEDHNIHMKIHLNDRLSIKFDRYSENQKAALEGHIQMHAQVLQQQAEAQAQAMMQAKGNAPQEPSQAGPEGQPV